MSFVQTKLTKSSNQSLGIFDKFIYSTGDTMDEVMVDGYFNNSKYLTDEYSGDDWVGGVIECLCSDGFFIGKVTEAGNTVLSVMRGISASESETLKHVRYDPELDSLIADVDVYIKLKV